MIEALGVIAAFLFSIATGAQALRSYKDGHSDGIHEWLIWSLLAGFVCMMIYVPATLGWDWILMSSYIVQIFMISVIGKYKYRPRK